MTTLISDLTVDLIRTGSSLGTSIDIIAAILIVVLLLERELLRAYESPLWSLQARTLDRAVYPLLIMFSVVVVAHLAELL
jgi:hypothetical protein